MSLSELGVTPPKGFRDILPQETIIRDHLLDVILGTYRSYGFERIETPVVEDLRRLKHSEGGENLGLMFKILKRGEKLDVQSGVADPDNLADLCLRYDLTVPLARYYANNRGTLPSVFKAIQVGSVWRAERPQKGRYRQFTQCDIDVIGGSSPFDEIELISVTLDAVTKLGIKGATVRVNDRRLLHAMVTEAGIPEQSIGRALVEFDKIDKVGLPGVHELLIQDGFDRAAVDKLIGFATEIGNLKPEDRFALAEKAFAGKVPESTCTNLKMIVDVAGAGLKNGNRVIFDPFLVRGMGYYTGPVFEIVVPEFSGSIAGGGRYDGLIGKLSGTDATACGFSIGFERLVGILGEQKAVTTSGRKIAIFFDKIADPIAHVLGAVRRFQSEGAVASMYVAPKNMRAALERLKTSGFTEFVRFSSTEPMVPKAL